MTLTELREFSTCAIEKIPGLNGGSLKKYSSYGLTSSGVVLGTAAAYSAKSILSLHTPFIIYTNTDNIRVVSLDFHFVSELRRQLSGEAVAGFSPKEQQFYTDYQTWVDGGTISNADTLLAVQALDLWLIEEVQLLEPKLMSPCNSTNAVPKIEIEE